MAHNHSSWVSCFQLHTCLRTKFTHLFPNTVQHASLCVSCWAVFHQISNSYLSLLWHINSVGDSALLTFVEQSDSWFFYTSVHHLAKKRLIVLTCQFVNMILLNILCEFSVWPLQKIWRFESIFLHLLHYDLNLSQEILKQINKQTSPPSGGS